MDEPRIDDPTGLPPPVVAPPPVRPAMETPAGPRPTDKTDPTADPRVERGAKPGELAPVWRVAMAVTWVAVMAAWAAIWNASVQIGLSTWWLGARGDPQPAIVRLIPFLIAGVVVVAALNRVKATPWIGIGAGVCLGLIALGDLGRVDRLALVEGAVALAAIAVSAASLTGRYRPAS